MDSDIKNQFIALYNEESDSIFRFCLLRTSDRDVALDLMQDTFLRFWDAFSQGKQRIQNKKAFLFAIARNGIIDWYRKKKSLSLDALAEDAEVNVEVFMDRSTGDREDIEMGHEARFLLEKIREIDTRYQQAVYLRYVEDLGPKEIAEVLGESVNIVSVHIYRGLKQLKKIAGYDDIQDNEK